MTLHRSFTLCATLALTLAAFPATAQVQLQLQGQQRFQDTNFGRLNTQLQDRRAQDVIRQAQQPGFLLNLRQPIKIDISRRKDLSDQLRGGIVKIKPVEDGPAINCDLRDQLRGVTLRPAKDFRKGFEATPCATLKDALTKQRPILDRVPTAKLRPVTNDEQQLLEVQPGLAERFPDGFTLAPFAVTTPEGTRFTVLFPDEPDRKLDLILKAPDPAREIDLGGPGVVLGVEETETTILYQSVEPIFDEGSLTFDPDNINGAFATGDLNSESCFGNDLGLFFNCFGATVAVEALIDPENPTTFGSAVLLDAEAGLYLSAYHVAKAHDGVFFTAGATNTPGQVNARFKMATGTFEAPEIETVDEDYDIHRTGFPVLNAFFRIDYDLILFRAEPTDPNFDPSLLTEARILATPENGPLRGHMGTQVVGAGYGGSPDEAGGGDGVRRFSRLAVAECGDDPFCADAHWLVIGERQDDFLSEGHSACPNDSGSALFVETATEDGDSGPIIAVGGILNGRIAPEVTLSETSEAFCTPTLRYVDLTHPDVQNWLVESAAVLTEQSEDTVRAAYFTDRPVVAQPDMFGALLADPEEN